MRLEQHFFIKIKNFICAFYICGKGLSEGNSWNVLCVNLWALMCQVREVTRFKSKQTQQQLPISIMEWKTNKMHYHVRLMPGILICPRTERLMPKGWVWILERGWFVKTKEEYERIKKKKDKTTRRAEAVKQVTVTSFSFLKPIIYTPRGTSIWFYVSAGILNHSLPAPRSRSRRCRRCWSVPLDSGRLSHDSPGLWLLGGRGWIIRFTMDH